MAMLVRELAKTLRRFGIRGNAPVPGAIAAGGFVTDPTLGRHILPLGRLGRSEDLAPMALAVLSNRVSRHGRRIRGRRRAVADELVRAAGAGDL
jgi:3-oxoacyl-[acyl-carrier protein] reductase